MTFRKEMEEMSKKTKRLEKENLALTRKHDQTNRNILEMAEERTRSNEELEKWRKKSNNLEALCRRMQEQGRGAALAGELDDEGTESDYEEDYEDEDDDVEGSEEGEYEIDPEHMPPPIVENQKPVFGPAPPPHLLEARANGMQAKGIVNGVNH